MTQAGRNQNTENAWEQMNACLNTSARREKGKETEEGTG